MTNTKNNQRGDAAHIEILKAWFADRIVTPNGTIHGRKLYREKINNTREYQLFEYYMQRFHLKRPVDLLNLVNAGALLQPTCAKCAEPIFTTSTKYCSLKCSNSDEAVLKKKRLSFAKSGGSWSFNTPEAKEKTKATNMSKFGVENIRHNVEYIKKKIVEKYGTVSTALLPEVQQKRRQTAIRKYGVATPSSAEIVKQKIRATKAAHTEDYKVEIRKKREVTNNARYGTPHPSNLPENRQRRWETKAPKYYDTFIKLLNNKNILLLSTKNEYIKKDKDALLSYKCKNCATVFNTDKTSPQQITCQTCAEHRWRSNGERSMCEWLESLGLSITTTNRNLISGEIDIFIPAHNIAIEYDGLYYHSDLFKAKDYHLNKTEQCATKNIRLIHVFENEWINQRSVVQSIIKSALGICSKIYARKCKIVALDNPTMSAFLAANHIQGPVACEHRYGLELNGEVVAVAGFGPSRFKKGEYELIRYCCTLNTTVVGGLSRLVKHFINGFNGDTLVSYVDRRYFTGSGYQQCGFELTGTSPPNYFYWRGTGDVVESRHKFQKHKLKSQLPNFDPTLSERENMINHGYLRIYDCGTFKFTYRKH